MSRFVKPETSVLTLPNGDSLIVKRRLNRGEDAEMLSRMRGADGRIDRVKAGIAQVLAYLLDWSLQDDNISIANLDYAGRENVLNGLDPDDFREIENAIDQHEAAVSAERAAKKASKDGANESSPTSPSATGIQAGATTT